VRVFTAVPIVLICARRRPCHHAPVGTPIGSGRGCPGASR